MLCVDFLVSHGVASLAQLAEHALRKRMVAGSIPAGGFSFKRLPKCVEHLRERIRLKNEKVTPAGLEPAIPGSVGRCLIHWATGPSASDGSNTYHRTEIWCEHAQMLNKCEKDVRKLKLFAKLRGWRNRFGFGFNAKPR